METSLTSDQWSYGRFGKSGKSGHIAIHKLNECLSYPQKMVEVLTFDATKTLSQPKAISRFTAVPLTWTQRQQLA
jgi:hypothetical protein